MIDKNPLGFGSGAPRFQKTKQENTPGPGAYSSKESLSPTSTKGTWSKASRKLTAHQQTQLLQKNPLDSMHDKLKSGYKFQKTQLKDGRNVYILGGLARDVKTFQKLCKTYATSHTSDCIQIQKNLLKDVNDELHLLIYNADLETDEFASKEVALIKELHGILTSTNQILRDSAPLMTENNELIDQLTERYTEQSNVVSVQFSDKPEHITRMANALREKRASLEDKRFVIKAAAGDQEKNLSGFTHEICPKAIRTHYSTQRKNGLPQSFRNIAAILVENGTPVSTTYVGTDNYGNPIGENTLFRLGSLSKFITGLAVEKLVQDPFVELEYTTKIENVFAKEEIESIFGKENYERAKDITLQQLVDQRTGIDNMGPNEGLDADFKLEGLTSEEMGSPVTSELLQHTKQTPIKFREGFTPEKGKFNYSNLNATLVGAMMEKVTKKAFQVIMQERIFNPLGLGNTNYDSPIKRQSANNILPSYAVSFTRDKSSNEFQKRTKFSDSNFFDPSAHIWTTPKDLSVLFSKLNSDESLTTSLRSNIKGDGIRSAYRNFSICNGGSVIGHNGGRDEYGSVGFLDLNSGKAIIVLENDGVQNVDMGAASISQLFGINPYHGDPGQVVK